MNIVSNSNMPTPLPQSVPFVAPPSVLERAKAHPARSFVYELPPSKVLAEAERIRDAANSGGYRHGLGIDDHLVHLLTPVAIECLIEGVHMLAMNAEITDYDVDHDEDWSGAEDAPRVTVAVVFEREEDAVCYRSALVAEAFPF